MSIKSKKKKKKKKKKEEEEGRWVEDRKKQILFNGK